MGFVTVTGVEVTPDLRHARVYVSVLGSATEKQATFDGLDSVASHLRSRVGRALRLRVAPEFQFREDDSIARAARIELQDTLTIERNYHGQTACSLF